MTQKDGGMIDLMDLKPTEDPVKVDILHPTTKMPLGLSVFVYGMDSEVYRNKHAELQAKRLSKVGPGKQRLSAADLEEDALVLLAHCTASWSENFGYNGKLVPCTPDNARQVYKDLDWLREQIDSAVSNRDLFIQASPGS